MIISLYKTSSDKLLAQKVLTDEKNFVCKLLDNCSIIRPTIEIELPENLSGYNYAFIPDFNRYYYIENTEVVTNRFWKFSLTLDDRMTYREALLQEKMTITRAENLYNFYLSDSSYVLQQNTNLQIKKFPNRFQTAQSIIMVGTGGVVESEVG